MTTHDLDDSAPQPNDPRTPPDVPAQTPTDELDTQSPPFTILELGVLRWCEVKGFAYDEVPGDLDLPPIIRRYRRFVDDFGNEYWKIDGETTRAEIALIPELARCRRG